MTRRILYLIESLGMGGAERGLVLNLRFLDRERFDPEVAILWEPSTLAREIEQMEIPVHRLNSSRGPRSLLSIPRVAGLLRKGEFDLIHTALSWSSMAGAIAGRLAGVKVVTHIANVDSAGWRARELPRSLHRRTSLRAALNALVGRIFVDRYVAVSQAAAGSAAWRSMRDPLKTTVVLRGQDLDELDREAAREPAAPFPEFGEPTIMTIGRLYPQKGQRFLIEAFSKVAGDYPNARLIFSGEGPLRDALEQQVSDLGLLDRVEFLGIRRDVPALLRRADVFAFPSLWEGQGNALVEAMALGRPIAASRIPAVEEALEGGDAGILVSPADPAGLAEAIRTLVEEPDRAAELGARARVLTRERFDIRSTTLDLERVYDEILGDTVSN